MTAERFGTRPSTLLTITDPVLALLVDEAVALRLAFRQMGDRRSESPARGKLPKGLQYEDMDDLARRVEAHRAALVH